MTQAAARKIIHVDMDAFYASVEQHDRPELRGRPVIVGGTPEGRGVVCAASYEARKFGVRSAMPAAQAKRLCPDAVFLRPDMARYQEVSQQVQAVFHEVTDRVEPLSLDEAYLDVTTNRLEQALAQEVARWVKQRIRDETGLTASAGVGPNKLVAKVASGFRKPDGLVVVPPERVQAFLGPLSVDQLWGVGPATAARLTAVGLHRVSDLRRYTAVELERMVGRIGPWLHGLALGDDPRPVEMDREPRSRGAERTLAEDVRDPAALGDLLTRLAEDVAESLADCGRPGRTVTLKLRFADFTTITRSRSLAVATADAAVIRELASGLLYDALMEDARRVRLLGVSVSNLEDPTAARQLWLPLVEKVPAPTSS